MSQERRFKCYYRETASSDLLQKIVVAPSKEKAGEFLAAMGIHPISIEEADKEQLVAQPQSAPPPVKTDPQLSPMASKHMKTSQKPRQSKCSVCGSIFFDAVKCPECGMEVKSTLAENSGGLPAKPSEKTTPDHQQLVSQERLSASNTEVPLVKKVEFPSANNPIQSMVIPTEGNPIMHREPSTLSTQGETAGAFSAHTHICTMCSTSFIWVKPANAWMLWMGWTMVALGLLFLPFAVLWIPGVILLVMGYRSRKSRCPSCGSKVIVMCDSPRGMAMMGEQRIQRDKK